MRVRIIDRASSTELNQRLRKSLPSPVREMSSAESPLLARRDHGAQGRNAWKMPCLSFGLIPEDDEDNSETIYVGVVPAPGGKHKQALLAVAIDLGTDPRRLPICGRDVRPEDWSNLQR